MNATTAARGGRDSRAATIAMACVGVFVAYLPVTTVSVSLPTIQRSLGASTADLSWVTDAFVLPMAALILTAGVVGDVYGRRKVFQAGLAFCATGAAIALSADALDSVEVLWTGQAFAGVGAAALLPATLGLISHAVPDPRERSKYVSLWTASLMGALAVGPMISGVILENAAWRWIFLAPIPASLLTMAAASRYVADSRAAGARRLDWPGQITAAIAITALVYAVIEGGGDSFGETRVLLALALSALSLVAFIVTELRSESPMLDLKLFRSPAFSATALVAMISFLGLIGFIFVLSLYLGQVQQLGTLDAGYRMLMFTFTAMVAGPVFGQIMHKVSARILITTGLLLATGSLLSLTSIDADTSFLALAWRLVILGIGFGAVFAPMTATAINSVPHQLAGMAAAGSNAFRQVGAALGPALMSALLTTKVSDALPGHLTDAGLGASARDRVTGAVDSGGFGAVHAVDLGADTPRMLHAFSQAFVDGLHLCLTISAAVMLVAAVVSAVLLRRPRPSAPAPSAPARRQEEPALNG
ncbi:MFS transporter [Streptomyces sp. TLI_146]|uniref:MFS transporter n=1 Tax=Streptomyces sp. TLI_146 TaxID=1938858 RepID=UPI000CB4B7DA|nr:EmrB/QacA subfamily drug resistance transporter [Streptomyces sp. TLI_146]